MELCVLGVLRLMNGRLAERQAMMLGRHGALSSLPAHEIGLPIVGGTHSE